MMAYTFGKTVASHQENSVSVAVDAFIELDDRIAHAFALTRSGFQQIGDTAEVRSRDDQH